MSTFRIILSCLMLIIAFSAFPAFLAALQPIPKRVLVYGVMLNPRDYGVFKELLENYGFIVDFAKPEETKLTKQLLSSYDILLMEDVDLELADKEELSAILGWVKEGGALLADSTYIMGQGFFAAYLSGVYVTYINMKVLSVPFSLKDVYAEVTVTLREEPFNYLVDNVTLSNRYYLLVKGLIQGFVDGKPLGVVSSIGNYTLSAGLYAQVGKGRVLIFPLTEISNNFQIMSNHNYQLVLNIFNWLADRQPTKADLSFQEARFQRYMLLAALLSVLAGFIVALSYKVKVELRRLSLILYAAILVFALLHVWYLYSQFSAMQKVYTELGFSFTYTFTSFLQYYSFYIASLAAVGVVGAAFWAAVRRVRDEYKDIFKFALGFLGGVAVISLYYLYFWVDYVPFITDALGPYIHRVRDMMFLLLGVPTAWVLLRPSFEKKFIQGFIKSGKIGKEIYEKLILRGFYGVYVFIALGIAVAVSSFSIMTYYTSILVWMTQIPQDVYTGISLSFYFVAALVISILMLRRALKEGLYEAGFLETLNMLVFTREFPYLLLTFNIIPSLASAAMWLIFGYTVDATYMLTPLIGIFVAYMVGYAVTWLFIKGIRTAAATIASALIILAYQLFISQVFLSKVTTLLDRTVTSGVLTIAIAGTMRKMLSEFTKKTLEKPKKEEKPPKLSEKEELEKLLEELDKALIEGRISEATYKELKEKYQRKLQELA